ncbi:MAG: hypothetical protein JXQ91_06730 [Vannielia sp.]|uniref:hypothetical protein n=1 Tax=Rhodobacterales TaxID=204455 RepID=UPI002094B17D|nr:hypothetical protein [Oceanicola sp. 502str15]MCO6384165.1 hypothetical protein [Oceanicola sp. 502str15]
MTRHLLAFFPVLLAGCVATSEGTQPAGPALGYELRPTGIGVPGSPQEVSFDRVNPGATVALQKLAGPVVTEEPCGNGLGLIGFRDGLVVVFRGRELVGWMEGERSAGITCGRT